MRRSNCQCVNSVGWLLYSIDHLFCTKKIKSTNVAKDKIRKTKRKKEDDGIASCNKIYLQQKKFFQFYEKSW